MLWHSNPVLAYRIQGDHFKAFRSVLINVDQVVAIENIPRQPEFKQFMMSNGESYIITLADTHEVMETAGFTIIEAKEPTDAGNVHSNPSSSGE